MGYFSRRRRELAAGSGGRSRSTGGGYFAEARRRMRSRQKPDGATLRMENAAKIVAETEFPIDDDFRQAASDLRTSRSDPGVVARVFENVVQHAESAGHFLETVLEPHLRATATAAAAAGSGKLAELLAPHFGKLASARYASPIDKKIGGFMQMQLEAHARNPKVEALADKSIPEAARMGWVNDPAALTLGEALVDDSIKDLPIWGPEYAGEGAELYERAKGLRLQMLRMAHLTGLAGSQTMVGVGSEVVVGPARAAAWLSNLRFGAARPVAEIALDPISYLSLGASAGVRAASSAGEVTLTREAGRALGSALTAQDQKLLRRGRQVIMEKYASRPLDELAELGLARPLTAAEESAGITKEQHVSIALEGLVASRVQATRRMRTMRLTDRMMKENPDVLLKPGAYIAGMRFGGKLNDVAAGVARDGAVRFKNAYDGSMTSKYVEEAVDLTKSTLESAGITAPVPPGEERCDCGV